MSGAASAQSIQCPGCQAGFRVKPEMAGRNVMCPKCQTSFTVPGASQPPTPRVPTPRQQPSSRLCGYCRQQIPLDSYEFHFNQHMATIGLTGSMPGYDEDRQFKGDISSQPRWYHHARCGQVSGMAEKIVRTYLANPWKYGYSSFCIGCRRGVPNAECTFIETGQNLQDHVRALQANHPDAAALKRGAIMHLIVVAFVLALMLAMILGGLVALAASWATAGIVFLVILLLGTAGLAGMLLKVRGGI